MESLIVEEETGSGVAVGFAGAMEGKEAVSVAIPFVEETAGLASKSILAAEGGTWSPTIGSWGYSAVILVVSPGLGGSVILGTTTFGITGAGCGALLTGFSVSAGADKGTFASGAEVRVGGGVPGLGMALTTFRRTVSVFFSLPADIGVMVVEAAFGLSSRFNLLVEVSRRLIGSMNSPFRCVSPAPCLLISMAASGVGCTRKRPVSTLKRFVSVLRNLSLPES